MPFRKTNRKPRRRRTLSKRISRLERVSRPEVKFQQKASGAFDTIGSVQGTLLQPQQLAEGVGRNQRIGDKVKSRNIRFQAIMKMGDAPSNSSCAIRVLALRAKYSDPANGTVDTGDFPNYYTSVDEDKFFVLKDILTQVSIMSVDPGVAYAGSTLKKVKFNLPCGLRKLQYDGSSQQSPSNNEVVIFIVAENQDAEIAYNFQHYYLDN